MPDTTPRPPSETSFAAQADAARDAQDWEPAARLYEQALQQRSNDASLHMQLGHCRKELGSLAGAEQAYLAAWALRPGDMDIPLQLGHLYSLRGNESAAVAHYKIAIAGGLNDRPARQYLARTGQEEFGDSAERDPSQTVIYFDFSDVVAYFQHSRFPTGIQRVQIELFKASRTWTGGAALRCCAYRQDAGGWAAIDPAAFATLIDLAAKPGGADDPEWRDQATIALAPLSERPALTFPPNAILINLGTSWWMDGYMASVRGAKRRFGLRYVPMVHDLIPLVAPDYVVPGMTADFAAWISSVYLHADAVIANSASTGRDVSAHAARVHPLARPLVFTPLDAEFNSTAPSPSDAMEDFLLDGFGLSRDRFVLFVGTLEARKSHLMVFQAWSRLILAHGPDAIPLLVCVGKQGWKFDAARAFLDSRPELRDKVMMLSGVSDEELYSLYDCCHFTVYASLYEGWGLPVTESLCHGKACLTADHSSLPEAGGRFAVYYEDGSLRSFMDQAYRLISDPEFVREREALIAAEYRPRPWSTLLQALVDDVLDRLGDPPASTPPFAAMSSGIPYRPGQRPALRGVDRDAAVAEMMRFEGEWHDREEWGAWSRAHQVRLAFAAPSSLQPQEDMLLYLEVRAATRPVTLSVRVGRTRVAGAALPALTRSYVQFTIPAAALPPGGEAGVIGLDTTYVTPLSGLAAADARVVGFGLSSITFVGVHDHAGRMAVIERATALARS